VPGSDGSSGGWRVCISHTSELRDYPDGTSYVAAVERAVSACGHVIVDMADFPAADQVPAELCAERVRECDVYVGVLGTRYGSPVRDRPEVSYTELEFDTATEAELPGRPRKFPARVVAEVKALACEPPAGSGKPLARWTCPELAREAAASGIVASVSASTVRRWLADDAIKPWQHRSRIFPRDPYFALKGGRVLDLYQREWEGQPLGADEYVLSADQKPGVRARSRTQLPQPPGPRRAMRTESEYVRCGTLACLAAYDVHRAHVFGRCEPSTGIKPFTALVDQVTKTEPCASAKRVFWVVDNGASHRNRAAAARLSDACPNAQMVHLPVHASWLNQIEVCFSVLQRKLLTPDDFGDLDSLAAQILAFEKHYNATARPFGWKFTRTDLNQLLARIPSTTRSHHSP
jgi:hypothetical protein